MIKKESIENLKNIIDIVDVISNYIEVKKSGTNFKALCPFHGENTPSFVINPNRGMYKCFGCGVGGDAIKFVQDIEHVEFIDAVQKIADFYNFELEREEGDFKKNNFEILEILNKFYKRNFDLNQTAKSYIKSRGIYDNSAEKFQIGFAPDSKTSIDFLKSKNIDLNDALEVGVVAKDKDFYARFINRITFPIFSTSGKIVGFGGRTISNHPAKYINSPQSKIFNKSSLLYGYNFAKDEIYKKSEIIVVEGYLDVIMLHQAGFKNAVATLGTALTSEHLPLLKKANPKLILAYDGDSAGVAAALKASKFVANSFDGGVIIFRDNLDPADMIKNKREDELRKFFKSPKPFIEFVLEEIVKNYDLKNPFQKEKALAETKEFLKPMSDIIKGEYRDFLANLIKVDVNLIKFENEKNYKREYKKPEQKEAKKSPLTTIDILELTIIKTLIDKPELFDLILERGDEKLIFKNYSNEIELIKVEDLENPKLTEVLMNENIKECSEDELQRSINTLLINLYQSDLEKLKKATISFEEKVFYIRKIQDSINRLKRGELIAYEEVIGI